MLADGAQNRVEAYAGIVFWFGQSRGVPIPELDSEPLLGMALVWDNRLTVEGWEDGTVVIEEVNLVT